MSDQTDLWRQFRAENPDVPAKRIEDLWREYVARAQPPETAVVKRKPGRPPKASTKAAASY